MTDPQKVLFLSHEASRTGAPLFLLNLLRWLKGNTDIQFEVLIDRPGELDTEFKALARVHFYEPYHNFSFLLKRFFNLHYRHIFAHRSQLRETFVKQEIGLIYANSLGSIRMLDFLSFLKCPVISHVHELECAIQTLGAKIEDMNERYLLEFIAVSNAVKANLVQNHKVSQDKVHVIHGFIPIPQRVIHVEPEVSRDRILNEVGIPKQSMIVCSCGSIERRKGIDLFMATAAVVTAQYTLSPVHFIWVGGSPSATKRRRRDSAEMNLKGVVHFVGAKADVMPYFDAADVFLLPSREDPFPLVVLEAALRGKPIVCFKESGGAAEVVEEDAGFAVSAFDVAAMAESTVKLLSDASLRREMGAKAKGKILARHGLAENAPRIAAIIKRFIKVQIKVDGDSEV